MRVSVRWRDPVSVTVRGSAQPTIVFGERPFPFSAFRLDLQKLDPHDPVIEMTAGQLEKQSATWLDKLDESLRGRGRIVVYVLLFRPAPGGIELTETCVLPAAADLFACAPTCRGCLYDST